MAKTNFWYFKHRTRFFRKTPIFHDFRSSDTRVSYCRQPRFWHIFGRTLSCDSSWDTRPLKTSYTSKDWKFSEFSDFKEKISILHVFPDENTKKNHAFQFFRFGRIDTHLQQSRRHISVDKNWPPRLIFFFISEIDSTCQKEYSNNFWKSSELFF